VHRQALSYGAFRRGCAAKPQAGVGQKTERKCTQVLLLQDFSSGGNMDLLLQCALGFEKLTHYQYSFLVGRKGKSLSFVISFDPVDFHHLAGLHKLRDNARFTTGKRDKIFKEILNSKLSLADAEKSIYFDQASPRLQPLSALEEFLDSNELVFRYNEKANIFSLIEADYLLENTLVGQTSYLFLAKRIDDDTHFCRSVFPKAEKDYSVGQPRYTLLKKEKKNLDTGEITIQFER